MRGEHSQTGGVVSGRVFGGRSRVRRRAARGAGEKLREARAGPAVRAGLAIDAAAVRLDDLLRDGEAEARAVRLRREKRLEQMLAKTWIDARSLVFHDERDAVA